MTEADRAAEQAMRGLLAGRFPEHGILGEEFGAERAEAEWRWVLDPIDGTRAFITGRPLFGTLVGLLHRGRPVLGVIDQPGIGERWVGAAGRTHALPFGRSAARRGCRPCAGLAAAELSCTSPDIFGAESALGLRAPARRRPPRHLGRRLLRLRTARPRPDGHGGRGRDAALGLGGAGAGGRGRGRQADRLGRPAAERARARPGFWPSGMPPCCRAH